MLSALEIIELEKKVLRYRLKQKIHYVTVSIAILTVGIIVFYIYPIILPYTNVSPKMQITTEITKPIESNLTAIVDPIIPESNNSIKYNPTVIVEEKEDQTLFLQLPSISKNGVEKKASYIPDIIEKKANIGVQEEELENKILMRKMPSIEEESFYRNKEDKVDTALLPPPPLLDEPKQKGLIKIEMHDNVNSIQDLKDKFEKTHNIVFALMLAEEYYSIKNYSECNKWALIANNTDPDSEKSWIWFAKSKIKLGHKEDAISALQAYLKNNKSKAAQSLLNQISVGEVLD